ncbi:MAG: type II toxin-antitoxin system PemK/MazF family toxin [Planctomycetaceae bacterium]
MKNRSDLVIVDFRSTMPTAGVRPALVIQNDVDNQRMTNTIVAQVTTTLHRNLEKTQVPIDTTHPDGFASGLRRPSVINCSNIYTIRPTAVARVVGTLSDATMQEIEACLKAALAMA